MSVQVADLDELAVGPAADGAAVEVGEPTDAWWRLVLGGPPPPAQRHVLGGAGALTVAAARWGRGHGARWGVLQVAVHNTAALALYARAGWTEHHRYRYLVPSGG